MKNHRTKLSRRVCYAIIAGMAGAFLIPQIGVAAPTGGTVVSGGATISRVGNDTNITGGATNNVIEWKDYSLTSAERVIHDGKAKTKNYLNIVTGANTSNINGKILGGNNVYIVNPNGVIFGKGAEVDVGNFYVSTQATNTVNKDADMANNVSPLGTTAGLSDVVNMGTLKATKAEVYGKHIRFLNAGDVTGSVVMHTDTVNDGTAHIGYRGTAPTSGYTVNGAAATAANNYYQLVSTTTEFQDINNDLTKNYMLENDIDFTVAGNKTAITPIGGNTKNAFTGKLDGNFFKVQNFTVSGVGYAGLFGKTDTGARVENLGVTGAEITGLSGGSAPPTAYSAGGIIAYATGTKLKNVYVKDTTVNGNDTFVGGIVGYTKDTTIDSAYSQAKIGEGGGIIGWSDSGTVVNDSYSNSSTLAGTLGTDFVYIVDPSGDTTINNSYAVGTRFTTTRTALIPSKTHNVYLIDKDVNNNYIAEDIFS